MLVTRQLAPSESPGKGNPGGVSSVAEWVEAMSGRIENQPDRAGASDWEVRQEEFVSANMRRVFVIIYRIVGNVSDAQDLTQETFIKALQKQEQIKDLEKAAHWLSRIASNTAIDFLRRQGRMGETELDEVAAPMAAPAERNPEALLLRAEHIGYLEAGLSRLTSRERAALILRDVEDLPAEEVARRLNCGKATVRSHIANARMKLRKYLERHRP
jgi:RNA polymerase sigma-70 factor (ECF subfamily)